MAEHLVKGGTPAVYLYLFARPVIGHWVGHASEIPFVFHMSPALVSPGNLKLSTAMVSYWTNFATSANPTPGSTATGTNAPHWPMFEPSGNKTSIRLDASFLSADITMQHDLRGAACDFWDSLVN